MTVRGDGPGLTRLVAEREPCRIAVDAPGVTVANLGGYGYVGVQDAADRFCCEDVYLTPSLDGRNFLPFGKKGRVHGRIHGLGPAGEDPAEVDVPALHRRDELPPRLLAEPRRRE